MSAPLNQRQFRHVTDVALKARIDSGDVDPDVHAEAARRGGLDYLNYQRSEWSKSPGQRDESKRISG